jgi:DNA-binding response OmpR family regulator
MADWSLPADPSLDGWHDTAPNHISRTYPGGLLLCVCENIPLNRRELLPPLEAAGYEVEMVEAHARRPLLLTDRPYRLLLLDIGTKHQSEYRLCAQVRSTSNLPILLMLRDAPRNAVMRGFQAGADGYIIAPFEVRELLARIGALLRRSPWPLPKS